MKSRNLILSGVLALVIAVPALTAQAASVAPPQSRDPVVKDAVRLATVPQRPALPDDVRNPFSAVAIPVASVAGPVASGSSPAPAPDRELLERLAPLVTPSGTMHVGGQPILLFGQNKVTEGDTLPVNFQGQPYLLVISHIDRTSFTLRLNGEEITRPIKPANRP